MDIKTEIYPGMEPPTEAGAVMQHLLDSARPDSDPLLASWENIIEESVGYDLDLDTKGLAHLSDAELVQAGQNGVELYRRLCQRLLDGYLGYAQTMATVKLVGQITLPSLVGERPLSTSLAQQNLSAYILPRKQVSESYPPASVDTIEVLGGMMVEMTRQVESTMPRLAQLGRLGLLASIGIHRKLWEIVDLRNARSLDNNGRVTPPGRLGNFRPGEEEGKDTEQTYNYGRYVNAYATTNLIFAASYGAEIGSGPYATSDEVTGILLANSAYLSRFVKTTARKDPYWIPPEANFQQLAEYAGKTYPMLLGADGSLQSPNAHLNEAGKCPMGNILLSAELHAQAEKLYMRLVDKYGRAIPRLESPFFNPAQLYIVNAIMTAAEWGLVGNAALHYRKQKSHLTIELPFPAMASSI